ncbi:MAG: hypothetical protein LBS18_05570 [Clostridiales bacterium]|jgi:multidrug efflux pump subunit AcrA (membrane-fusion protein)|nr:hypothetical protein [Clostridiales bacterium]
MGNKVDTNMEERWAPLPDTGIDEMGQPEPIDEAAKPSRRKRNRHGFFSRLPALPRFSDPAQRRIGGYIVLFFVGLLILTLIARGTSGATLARVELSNPVRGEIMDAITEQATVSARDTLDITAPEGLTIEELLVGSGQSVQTGDAVARFDMDEVQEKLTREAAGLDKLLLDIDKLERTEKTDATSVDQAKKSLQRAEDDYDTTRAQGEADIDAAAVALSKAFQNVADAPDTFALDTAQRNLTRAQEDNTAAIAQADQDVAAAQSAYENAENDTEKAKALEALKAAQIKADDTLLSAQRKVEDAQAALTRAEQDYYKSSDQSSDALQAEIEKAKDALTAAIKKAEENRLSAERRIEDAMGTLQKAEQDYEKNARQTADTAAQNSLSAVSLLLDIEKQQAVVDALKSLVASDGVLYSDVSGAVSFARAASSVTNQEPLVAFTDSAGGFQAHVLLDSADAEKLSVGEDCEVTTGGGSMYYNPTVTGSVSAIAQPDDKDTVQVTINLPEGDWEAGQRVDVRMVQDSGTYELCVPLSAIHSDNTGYYLLVVEQESTVLGVENVVSRVSVSITASDDDMAAVQGPVSRNALVITGSNKAVAAGDRVRMQDE